jgi:hypothetical protein
MSVYAEDAAVVRVALEKFSAREIYWAADWQNREAAGRA